MYKRYESMAGDITMAAPRRLLAVTMAKAGQKVYSYRWDVAALNSSSTIGVGHFAEVSYLKPTYRDNNSVGRYILNISN